jgi:hypothetical protein
MADPLKCLTPEKRRFPVLANWSEMAELKRLGCPRDVPWEFVAEHREQCLHNHDQTPERLAERGGLGPAEMFCVVTDQHWRELRPLDDAALCPELLILLADWEKRRAQQ